MLKYCNYSISIATATKRFDNGRRLEIESGHYIFEVRITIISVKFRYCAPIYRLHYSSVAPIQDAVTIRL